MAKELILLKNVEKLGVIGDNIRVADGYARNFLLPRNLAILATDINIRQLESKKAQALKEYQNNILVAQKLAEKLKGIPVMTIMANAGDEDKLFGSITNVDIASALLKSGYEINRRAITIPKAIKLLGLFDFSIKLHQEVSVNLKILVSKV